MRGEGDTGGELFQRSVQGKGNKSRQGEDSGVELMPSKRDITYINYAGNWEGKRIDLEAHEEEDRLRGGHRDALPSSSR